MTTNWTVGRMLAGAVVLISTLVIAMGALAVVSLERVVQAKDDLINRDLKLVHLADQMQISVYSSQQATRNYLRTGSANHLGRSAEARSNFDDALNEAVQLVHSTEGERLVETIRTQAAALQRASAVVIDDNRDNLGGADSVTAIAEYLQTVSPLQDALTQSLDAFAAREQALADASRERATASARVAASGLLLLVVIVTSLTVTLGWLVTRRVRQRISGAVSAVRTSSADLQATATQQAAATESQAAAMAQITTTITELQVASQQIAEGARQVADVTDQTAEAGRVGEETLVTAQQAIDNIRSQVAVIVNHMVELGERSQRMGVVLQIVSELAEQTHILAINSTIEAAGAGESGKRFAVVADEIRRLADRVAESTKEVRSMIDIIRSAVGTTVMATEAGAKAVDSGAATMSEVTASFHEISQLVESTTQATRAIEHSTRQQATAVEQVSQAVTQVTQASRKTQQSTTQTSITATELTGLSAELLSLVKHESRAPRV